MDVNRALFALTASARVAQQAVKTYVGMMLALLSLTLTVSCTTPNVDPLTEITSRGVLRVAIQADLLPADASSTSSFDLSLAQGFAQSLNATLHIVAVANEAELVNAVRNGQADIALAMSQRLARVSQLPVSVPYHAIEYVVVGKQGDAMATSLPEITRELRVSAGSAAASLLIEAKRDLPSIRWTESTLSSKDLLGQIIDEKIAYSMVSDYLLAPNLHRLPALRVAFQLDMPDALVWAYGAQPDNALQQLANRYLHEQISSGRVAAWRAELLAKPGTLNFLERQSMATAVVERLPDLRAAFVLAAQSDLDWRFIAAMAYQESHWRADAVSGTGVTGIMMLTEDTAARMGVNDRKDPVQSIRGGADYFRELEEKIPARIVGEDRVAFTLAAYNIGFRHLEDARLLTARRGGNKDAWRDVKKHLPALRDPLVYATLRYGYARGDEAVDFVESVYRYHAALRWLDRVDDDTTARRMAGKALPGFHRDIPAGGADIAATAVTED